MKIERKQLQVVCSLVWCIVAAGIVFGFAALKPVLIAQGVYKEKCNLENVNSVLNTSIASAVACTEQDLSLNFLFTLAAVVTNTASLAVGAILDKYGPQTTGIIGSGLLFVASFLLSYAQSIKFLDAYLIGYSVLALGGPFVFISCFHLANAFPKNSGLILALLTGAFDSSSAIFLLYRMSYFSSWGNGLTLHKFFLGYAVVPIFIFFCQITIMEKDTYQITPVTNQKFVSEIGTSTIDDIENAIETEVEEYLPVQRTAPKNICSRRSSSTTGLLEAIDENLSKSLQNSSPNLLTDQFAMRRSNSFTQKVLKSRASSFSNDLSDEQTNTRMNNIRSTITNAIENNLSEGYENFNNKIINQTITDSISIIKQTKIEDELTNKSGIDNELHLKPLRQQIATPWFVLMALFTSIQMLRINYFVATIRSQEEYLLKDPALSKQINEFFDLALPIGGLLSIPFIGLLLDNFKTITTLFVLFCISMSIGILGIIPNMLCNYLGIMLMVLYRPFYYTAVSDYCAKVFGFNSFGVVYGSIICISGVFNFVQTYLDGLTHSRFNLNPIPVNAFLTSLTFIIGGSLLIFIKLKSRAKLQFITGGEAVSYGAI